MHRILLAAVATALAFATAAAAVDEIRRKYPMAGEEIAAVENFPLFGEILQDEEFFAPIESDRGYWRSLSSRLLHSASVEIASTTPVRMRIMQGTVVEKPAIFFSYQTDFERLWDLPAAQQTFFGGTQCPDARAEFRELIEKRSSLPHGLARDLTEEEFQELFKRVLPDGDLDEVRAEIVSIIKDLVKALEPYGAKILDNPELGHFGAKLAPHLYVYIRDFPADPPKPGQENTVRTGLRYRHDSFFWLVLSGGPREMPEGYLPAFPGAEGMGAVATGGRGGKVIYVTNLNPDGPGSLQEALNTPGPRTVLFNVSGSINVDDLWITEDDLTLIGYTAPGEGIEVVGRLQVAASNLIIRGMRFRVRPPLDDDGLNVHGTRGNVIFDHCSFAYGSDELLRFVGMRDTFNMYTFQYCLMGPAMAGIKDHPFGPEVGGMGTLHHNILMHTTSRSPEVDGHLIDWRNNIMYNCRSGHNRRPESRMNYVNCYVIEHGEYPFEFSFSNSTNTWIDGNLRESAGRISEFFGTRPNDYLKEPFRTMPVKTHDARELEELLTPVIGAFLPVRDATDEHFIGGMTSRKGLIPWWDSGTGKWVRGRREMIFNLEVYERWRNDDFPGPRPGTAPYDDSDGDGIPDWWEIKYGLDPQDPSDAQKDMNGSGYTNLEEYLNGTDPTVFVDYRDPANNVHSLHNQKPLFIK